MPKNKVFGQAEGGAKGVQPLDCIKMVVTMNPCPCGYFPLLILRFLSLRWSRMQLPDTVRTMIGLDSFWMTAVSWMRALPQSRVSFIRHIGAIALPAVSTPEALPIFIHH